MLHIGQSESTAVLEQAASDFVDWRPRLFGVAYRILGSSSEAEDIVQEVWLRWQTTDRTVVKDPPAFLATTATRLAINVAQSARSRREAYVGPWLPEPVDTSTDPELGAERGEALELAVLLLLEKLTATERAAFVLREAFDYSYEQIASILQLSEANTRQLVSRARKHIASQRHGPVSSYEHRRLLEAFLVASQKGDLAALESILASDVVSYSDGGGVVHAARIPVVGRERVAKFMATIARTFWPGLATTWVEANGRASVLASHGRIAVALMTISASSHSIQQIMWVMNPTKLAGMSRFLPVVQDSQSSGPEPTRFVRASISHH
jgi:RNA polymerase sigma-70 factor (ECF subfamily)